MGTVFVRFVKAQSSELPPPGQRGVEGGPRGASAIKPDVPQAPVTFRFLSGLQQPTLCIGELWRWGVNILLVFKAQSVRTWVAARAGKRSPVDPEPMCLLGQKAIGLRKSSSHTFTNEKSGARAPFLPLGHGDHAEGLRVQIAENSRGASWRRRH